MAASSQYHIGDSVMVKPDVVDPDLGIPIGGWQGTISDISDKDGTVCIDWDSHTLQTMPASSIDACEVKGLAWNQIYLDVTDVEAATRRDTPEAVAQMVHKLFGQHRWSHLEEEGACIQAIIGAVDPDDGRAILKTWRSHLRHVLRLPFAAKIDECHDRCPLFPGDRVTVEAITDIDNMYGVLVTVKHKRDTYQVPLSDLKVIGQKSPNHDAVQPYAVWFANR